MKEITKEMQWLRYELENIARYLKEDSQTADALRIVAESHEIMTKYRDYSEEELQNVKRDLFIRLDTLENSVLYTTDELARIRKDLHEMGWK